MTNADLDPSRAAAALALYTESAVGVAGSPRVRDGAAAVFKNGCLASIVGKIGTQISECTFSACLCVFECLCRITKKLVIRLSSYQTSLKISIRSSLRIVVGNKYQKGLILAQNERWRRGLGMQVERETPQGVDSGVRERNTWIICPQDRDSCGKLQVIPDNISGSKV